MELLYLNHEGKEYVVHIGPIHMAGIQLLELHEFEEIQPALQQYARSVISADQDASGARSVPSAEPALPPAAWWTLAVIGATLTLAVPRTLGRLIRR